MDTLYVIYICDIYASKQKYTYICTSFPSHRYMITNRLNLKVSLCMLIMEDRNLSGSARQIDHLHILQHFLSTQR